MINPRNPRGLPTSHPADAERFGFDEEREPSRWFLRALVAVVLALLAAYSGWARAAGCDGTEWDITNTTAGGTTGPYDFGSDACAGAAAWVSGWAGTISNCSATSTSISFDGTSSQLYHFTGVKTGCEAAPPPDPSASGVTTINAVLVLPDWMNPSAEDGLALSAAILSVWATAFAFRSCIRALNAADGDND